MGLASLACETESSPPQNREMFVLSIIAQTSEVPFSPWLVGGGVLSLISLLAYLVIRVVRVGSDQYLLASKQAQELLKPMHAEVARLTDEVKKCKEESLAERLWHQILVARLERIIRRNGVEIPEETWLRP